MDALDFWQMYKLTWLPVKWVIKEPAMRSNKDSKPKPSWHSLAFAHEGVRSNAKSHLQIYNIQFPSQYFFLSHGILLQFYLRVSRIGCADELIGLEEEI